MSAPATVAGIFSGIGGLEVGLAPAGAHTALLCEAWQDARAVLGERFPGTEIHHDVTELDSLPEGTELVAAGFPCQDLSQAGRTAGITGKKSGLVSHVFRLLADGRPEWLLIENVRNMLSLDKGAAMAYLTDRLEDLGYSWAYRLVDSRFTGVPHRRQRVILLASRTQDPRAVLLADQADDPGYDRMQAPAYGFYWSEGLRGVGWTPDGVPTLKGGSGVGIPTPPAVWIPSNPIGRRLVTPLIEDTEELQGFPRGWTDAEGVTGKGARWTMTGNAVTAGVSSWVGRRLAEPGERCQSGEKPLAMGSRWPSAAWGRNGERYSSNASLWPALAPYTSILDVISSSEARALSARAAAGFHSRALRSTLNFAPGFLEDVALHVKAMREG